MYKFVSKAKYESDFKDLYPNARHSPDNSEVVLSTPSGDKTREEAIAYINSKWNVEP